MKLTIIGLSLIFISMSIFYIGILDEYIRPAIIYHSPLSNEAIGAPGLAATHYTTKHQYKRGEMVEARVNYTKNRPLVADVQWKLSNILILTYPPRRGGLPALGHAVKVIPIEVIPKDSKLGTHFFIGTSTYRINFLLSKTYPIRTNDFEVVE